MSCSVYGGTFPLEAVLGAAFFFIILVAGFIIQAKYPNDRHAPSSPEGGSG